MKIILSGAKGWRLFCLVLKDEDTPMIKWVTVHTLLRQTKQLREENEELRTQMSIVGTSQSWYTQSRQTTSRRTVEAYFLGSTKFSSDSYSRRSEEEPSLAHQTQLDEGTNSTRTSRKRRPNRGSHLFEAIWAQLGPQALGVEVQPRMSNTLRARID